MELGMFITNVRYTKMGYSGNSDPQFIIPTTIASKDQAQTAKSGTQGGGNIKKGIDDLDFFIGDEAIANSKSYSLNYPVRHGQVDNWDLMEKFHQACIFQYLRCEPEDHSFLLVKGF
jgi:actin-related protein 3